MGEGNNDGTIIGATHSSNFICFSHSDCNNNQFCSKSYIPESPLYTFPGNCVEYDSEYCDNNICYEGEGDCDDGNVGGTDTEGCADIGVANYFSCGIDNCNFGK